MTLALLAGPAHGRNLANTSLASSHNSGKNSKPGCLRTPPATQGNTTRQSEVILSLESTIGTGVDDQTPGADQCPAACTIVVSPFKKGEKDNQTQALSKEEGCSEVLSKNLPKGPVEEN